MNLSYPIGQFVKPANIDHSTIDEWISQIETLPSRFRHAVESLSEEQLDSPYRPGGWSIRQLIHHVPDSHINSYVRFHWALTENTPKIKAYHEAAWAELSYLQTLDIHTSLDLLSIVHKRWTALLRSLTVEDLKKSFIHPDNNKAYELKEVIGMYAWHGEHHLAHVGLVNPM